MHYTPITAFRAAVSAELLETATTAPDSGLSVDKWSVLRNIGTIRKSLGLSDRTLAVLQTLLSFYPGRELSSDANLVVFPSNAKICERLNGMPCSTMRRHLASLVNAGILVRRDSPNGKRFSRMNGPDQLRFGLDLTPLVLRASEFEDAAAIEKEAQERLKQTRIVTSVMRRDLSALVAFGRDETPDWPLWDQIDDLCRLTARDLRRKLDLEELATLQVSLKAALIKVHQALDTEEMSTKSAENEHHDLQSNKEYTSQKIVLKDPAPIPLRFVLGHCEEIQSFMTSQPHDWGTYTREAEKIAPMIGLSPVVWGKAKQGIGVEGACVTLALILERLSEIKSPNAYLSCLTQKAVLGQFSVAAMLRNHVHRLGSSQV